MELAQLIWGLVEPEEVGPSFLVGVVRASFNLQSSLHLRLLVCEELFLLSFEVWEELPSLIEAAWPLFQFRTP